MKRNYSHLTTSKPNSQLTQIEKDAKKSLKKQIKLAKRQRRERHRLQNVAHFQAEQSAKIELTKRGQKWTKKPSRTLADLLKAENSSSSLSSSLSSSMSSSLSSSSSSTNKQYSSTVDTSIMRPPSSTSTIREQCIEKIRTVVAKLLSQSVSKSKKITREAGNKLLRHMTKGTQELNMMTSETAIWGYVSYKFAKRCLLTFDTLRRLRPETCPNQLHQILGNCNHREAAALLWTHIGNVSTAVSVGGGSGNNLYAVLLLHQFYYNTLKTVTNTEKDSFESNTSPLKQLIVLDFASDEWHPVISHLSEICRIENKKQTEHRKQTEHESSSSSSSSSSTEHESSSLSSPSSTSSSSTSSSSCEFLCHQCDVTLPLSNPFNERAKITLSNTNLIIISYLLTETRGKWNSFFMEMFDNAIPGTLILLMEPTVWQHHIVLQLLGLEKDEEEKDMDTNSHLFLPNEKTYYWWLDSLSPNEIVNETDTIPLIDAGKTMHRNGPGILLIRKAGGI